MQGTMSSLTSMVNLGGLMSGSSSERSHSLIRRVSVSKGSVRCRKRWHFVSVSVCRCSITTTDFVSEQSNAISLASNDSRGSKGGVDDAGFLLKPPPKPFLKSPDSKGNPLLGKKSTSWSLDGDSDDKKLREEEEKRKVIESLGEVLKKAERLERPVKLEKPDLSSGIDNGSIVKPTANNTNANMRTDASQAADETKKSKTMKSVWRKGDAVATIKKVVEQLPKTNPNVMREEPQIRGGQISAFQSGTLEAPKRPSAPQPSLQAKPSVASTPPLIKKPVILRDVGAAPKSSVIDKDDTRAGSTKGPILIDKYASKKALIDPSLIGEEILDPKKPGKGLSSKKFKDDYRRRSDSGYGGLRRRISAERKVDMDDDDNASISGVRKGRKWSKASRRAARMQAARDAAPVKVEILEVGEDGMRIEELSYNLAISEGEILGSLYSKGIKPDGVQTLDKDIVKMICNDYDVEVLDADPFRVEQMAKKMEVLDEEDLDRLKPRPPVITIMGHVDHGKTTLLDHIRSTKVAASEAGGITQGIGAYKVPVPMDGETQPCVFLDTPGHEAFGAMRARGARVTDIAIIVVAADDGIRPQTNEAIAHAKSAGVPIIIAINKIDKDGANPDRVMQELASVGLMAEEWGGDIPMVQISALKGQNIDELLETTMLVAELQELKANPDRSAKGTVIEAGLDKAKGPIATFIVQNGTLRRGDVVVCGESFGKVRALMDDAGKRVDVAEPSMPVQVLGLNNVPLAGDIFEVVDSLDSAREKANLRAMSLREERILAKAGDGKVTLSSLASAVSSRKLTGLDLHQLNMILKVDVQGSIEAIKQALQMLPDDNVTLKFLLHAAGDITNSDVDLAFASKAIIFGFNVKALGSVKSYAENKGVEIRIYKVIYELIDDVRSAMEGLLDPVEEREPIGSAEVRAKFSSGSGRVAGCMVLEGKLVKGCGIRVIRKGREIHVGELDSLKRVKEVVKEVGAGLECGVGVDDFDDWQEGDKIEAFNTYQKRRTLEEASASMAAAVEKVATRV